MHAAVKIGACAKILCCCRVTDLHDCSFTSITYSTSSSSSCELSLEDPAAPVRISSRTQQAKTLQNLQRTLQSALQRTLHTALSCEGHCKLRCRQRTLTALQRTLQTVLQRTLQTVLQRTLQIQFVMHMRNNINCCCACVSLISFEVEFEQ